jgi:DnaJ domain
MAESEDVISLLFYVLLVYPICNWILTPNRFPKKKSIMYAIAFLSFIALSKLGLEWKERGPNYYQLLEVSREASPLEIKRAYKKLGLELHPDKNPNNPEAAEQFSAMKNAYDVLMDQEFRDIYNKLGPEAIKSKRRVDETQLLLEIAIYYITWGVLAYVLTLGKSGSSARSYIYTGQIALLILEVSSMSMTQGQSMLPSWFLPSMTDHEVILILRTIFPAFLNGCRSICGFLYVDIEKQTRDLMLELQKGHNAIVLQLQLMQTELRDVARNGGGGGGGGASRLATSAAASAKQQQPLGQLRDLEERMKASASGVNTLATPIQEPAKAGRSKFWLILGAYVVFCELCTLNHESL